MEIWNVIRTPAQAHNLLLFIGVGESDADAQVACAKEDAREYKAAPRECVLAASPDEMSALAVMYDPQTAR